MVVLGDARIPASNPEFETYGLVNSMRRDSESTEEICNDQKITNWCESGDLFDQFGCVRTVSELLDECCDYNDSVQVKSFNEALKLKAHLKNGC